MADIKFTGASTSPADTQQYVISKAGLQALAAATYTKAVGPTTSTGAAWTQGSGAKHITIYKGDGSKDTIGVGSDIVFTTYTNPAENTAQKKGTFRVKIDGTNYEVPINGLSDNGTTSNIGVSNAAWTNGYITNLYGTNVGSSSSSFTNGYITNLYGTNVGSSGSPFTNGYITNIYGTSVGSTSSPWTTGYITTLYGTNLGSNSSPFTNAYITNLTLSGPISGSGALGITDTTNGVTPDNTTATSYSANTAASIHTSGGIYAAKDIWARRVFNAVFNDYAEYRTTIDLTPGHVVIDKDDGSLICTSARLQPGAQVISDTFGHSMGQTLTATTPIAVAGRVLVYPYQARENYHAGMAVCSAPNGTVDIMTREEIRDYPDCIVGIVSEIPEYETWGSDNVKVDGRIWVRIK